MTEAERPTMEQLDKMLWDVENNPANPSTGQIWVHYKGGRYTVVCLSLREDDLEVVVTYAPALGETIGRPFFTRTLASWHEQVANNTGRLVTRYSKEIR